MRDLIRKAREQGVEKVLDILARIDPEESRLILMRLVQVLGNEAPDLAEKIKARLFTVESYISAITDNRHLQKVLEGMSAGEIAEWAPELSKASLQRVLGCVSKNRREDILREMETAKKRKPSKPRDRKPPRKGDPNAADNLISRLEIMRAGDLISYEHPWDLVCLDSCAGAWKEKSYAAALGVLQPLCDPETPVTLMAFSPQMALKKGRVLGRNENGDKVHDHIHTFDEKGLMILDLPPLEKAGLTTFWLENMAGDAIGSTMVLALDSEETGLEAGAFIECPPPETVTEEAEFYARTTVFYQGLPYERKVKAELICLSCGKIMDGVMAQCSRGKLVCGFFRSDHIGPFYVNLTSMTSGDTVLTPLCLDRTPAGIHEAEVPGVMIEKEIHPGTCFNVVKLTDDPILMLAVDGRTSAKDLISGLFSSKGFQPAGRFRPTPPWRLRTFHARPAGGIFHFGTIPVGITFIQVPNDRHITHVELGLVNLRTLSACFHRIATAEASVMSVDFPDYIGKYDNIQGRIEIRSEQKWSLTEKFSRKTWKGEGPAALPLELTSDLEADLDFISGNETCGKTWKNNQRRLLVDRVLHSRGEYAQEKGVHRIPKDMAAVTDYILHWVNPRGEDFSEEVAARIYKEFLRAKHPENMNMALIKESMARLQVFTRSNGLDALLVGQEKGDIRCTLKLYEYLYPLIALGFGDEFPYLADLKSRLFQAIEKQISQGRDPIDSVDAAFNAYMGRLDPLVGKSRGLKYFLDKVRLKHGLPNWKKDSLWGGEHYSTLRGMFALMDAGIEKLENVPAEISALVKEDPSFFQMILEYLGIASPKYHRETRQVQTPFWSAFDGFSLFIDIDSPSATPTLLAVVDLYALVRKKADIFTRVVSRTEPCGEIEINESLTTVQAPFTVVSERGFVITLIDLDIADAYRDFPQEKIEIRFSRKHIRVGDKFHLKIRYENPRVFFKFVDLWLPGNIEICDRNVCFMTGNQRASFLIRDTTVSVMCKAVRPGTGFIYPKISDFLDSVIAGFCEPVKITVSPKF